MSITGEVPPLAAFLRPELPPAALHGLPGEVAVTLSEAAGADPAAVLVSFLALLGNAAGPQPHARFGGAEHPARLFAVLVGDAATGRKGTALAAVGRARPGSAGGAAAGAATAREPVRRHCHHGSPSRT